MDNSNQLVWPDQPSTRKSILMDACPTPVLTDDHLDLLVSAASAWGLITSPTRAAFTTSHLERELASATGPLAGALLQRENLVALQWLAANGRSRLAERPPTTTTYAHRPVEHLIPVEVIKAAHRAEAACRLSPTWQQSLARRLLTGIITAATQRLPGYAEAPWMWSRPQRRRGTPIGIRLDHETCPEISGLEWVGLDLDRRRWDDAQLVLVTPSAAVHLPADLPSRPGVLVFVVDENHNSVWESLSTLEMQTLALFWPACREWLLDQLSDPALEFVEHRSGS